MTFSAKAAAKGVPVRYVAPKEGAQVGFDMLAIPADAPDKAEALAFINFVLRPDIMARITDATHYPNAIPATRKLVNPELLNDPNVFPTEADMRRYFRVSPPAVHEMVKSLEWNGFIAREPGRPRSIRLVLGREELPDLD